MNNTLELWRKIVFNIQWLYMKPERRYQSLWNRVKNNV
jgi:hypothetical protein